MRATTLAATVSALAAAALLFALVVALGNITIPVAVLTGLIS